MTNPTEARILEHAHQLETLLPPGKAWSAAPTGPMFDLLAGFAQEFANLEARVQDLLREWNPYLTTELLEEWESAVGLPDECVGSVTTLDQRRAAVVARVVSLTGGDAQSLIQLAALLGYQIRIVEHRPFQVGRSRVGDALSNHQRAFQVGVSAVGDALSNLQSWLWTVDVIAPLTTVRRFAVGRSAVGEPLASYGNALLECTLARVAPAHVLLRFLYELQIQLDASPAVVAAVLPPLFGALYDPDDDDDMGKLEPLVNAVSPISGELWGLAPGQTTAIDLPPVFVVGEMFRNGGTLHWFLAGVYFNSTGSPFDLELALYNGDAAATPFATVCVEGVPSASPSSGVFQLEIVLHVRGTNQAHGRWECWANPNVVADGSTASGQAAAFHDGDLLRMFSLIDWTTDTKIVPRLRKKAATAAELRVFEIVVTPEVVRSGAK